MREILTATPINEDFGAVLNCAVRYCIGRQTYMPGLVIGYVTPLLPSLDDRTLRVFERDLSDAKYFGDEQIDKPMWMAFYRSVVEEMDRRAKVNGQDRL